MVPQVFAGEEQRKKEEAARGVERFISEVAHAGREMLQGAPILIQRRRKQRNDAVLMWHQRQKQRATRAERLRVQALKAGKLMLDSCQFVTDGDTVSYCVEAATWRT